MNINELKQVQDDLNRGVMVCSATIRRVVAHAMTQAETPVEDEAPENVLGAAWTALKQRGLRPIRNRDDYEVMHALGNDLADEIGDDNKHPLISLFDIVMTLMSEWERNNVVLEPAP